MTLNVATTETRSAAYAGHASSRATTATTQRNIRHRSRPSAPRGEACSLRRAKPRTAVPPPARSPDRRADCHDRTPTVPQSTPPVRSAVANAIDAATPSPQHRAAAAGSSIGPTASSVPKAWKLATSDSTTSVTNIAPYGARVPTTRRNAGSNAPTASGRYSTAITSRITLAHGRDLQQRVPIDRQHSAEQHAHDIDIAAPPRHQHHPERERDQIECHQARVVPRPTAGDQSSQRRHGKSARQPAQRQPGRRRPRIQEADRGAGHHRMSEHIAVEAHPPQHQQRADGPVGQRQCQARDQRRAHEPERLERRHQQRVRRHHAAIAGNATSVASQATQRRASTSVDGKPCPHQVEIMQHGDHGATFLVPSGDLIEQHRRGLRIDRGERFVEQDHAGVLQDQPCEQRPLQLADRQLANPPRQPSRQPDRPRRRLGTRPQRCRRRPECAEFAPAAERDQLRHGQRVVAIDRRKLRQIRQSPRCARRTIDGPGGQSHGARDRCQQRALAGAVGADDGGQAARCERTGDRLKRQPPPVANRYIS